MVRPEGPSRVACWWPVFEATGCPLPPVRDLAFPRIRFLTSGAGYLHGLKTLLLSGRLLRRAAWESKCQRMSKTIYTAVEAGDGEVDVQSRTNISLRSGRGRGQRRPRN